MTRKELIQSPEYWKTLYENECERLGIKPNLIFIKPINEKQLNKLAEKQLNPYSSKEEPDLWFGFSFGFKQCY